MHVHERRPLSQADFCYFYKFRPFGLSNTIYMQKACMNEMLTMQYCNKHQVEFDRYTAAIQRQPSCMHARLVILDMRGAFRNSSSQSPIQRPACGSDGVRDAPVTVEGASWSPFIIASCFTVIDTHRSQSPKDGAQSTTHDSMIVASVHFHDRIDEENERRKFKANSVVILFEIRTIIAHRLETNALRIHTFHEVYSSRMYFHTGSLQ